MSFFNSVMAAAFAIGLAGGAQAATIQNGSFEEPGVFSGSFTSPSAGSNAITGWTIGGGGVDLINTLWQHQDGNYSLDMNQTSAGSISQDITGLIVGQSYRISFWMASNSSGNPVLKLLDVTAGSTTQSYSFDKTGSTTSNMNWTEQSLLFQASATSETLTFASTIGGAYGPALDNVSIAAVSAVPLPAGGALLLSGLLGMGILRRKRNG